MAGSKNKKKTQQKKNEIEIQKNFRKIFFLCYFLQIIKFFNYYSKNKSDIKTSMCVCEGCREKIEPNIQQQKIKKKKF